MRAFEAEHGPLPEGGWLLLRTGWDARAQDEAELPQRRADGRRARRARTSSARAGWPRRARIVGLRRRDGRHRRGRRGRLRPAVPGAHFLLGAGKYGITQLANLAELPPTGALLVVAPLKLVDGTGSPCRVLALVPGGAG